MVSAAIWPIVVILATLTRDKRKSWIAVVTSFVIQNVTHCGVGSLVSQTRLIHDKYVLTFLGTYQQHSQAFHPT